MKLGLWVLGKNLSSALSTLDVIKRGMCYQEFSLTLFDYLIKMVSAKSLYCEVSCHPFPEYTLTHTNRCIKFYFRGDWNLAEHMGPSEKMVLRTPETLGRHFSEHYHGSSHNSVSQSSLQ